MFFGVSSTPHPLLTFTSPHTQPPQRTSTPRRQTLTPRGRRRPTRWVHVTRCPLCTTQQTPAPTPPPPTPTTNNMHASHARRCAALAAAVAGGTSVFTDENPSAMFFDIDQLNATIQHLQEQAGYPGEQCGVGVGGTFYVCTNTNVQSQCLPTCLPSRTPCMQAAHSTRWQSRPTLWARCCRSSKMLAWAQRQVFSGKCGKGLRGAQVRKLRVGESVCSCLSPSGATFNFLQCSTSTGSLSG